MVVYVVIFVAAVAVVLDAVVVAAIVVCFLRGRDGRRGSAYCCIVRGSWRRAARFLPCPRPKHPPPRLYRQ